MLDQIKQEVRARTKNIEWEFGYKDRKLICKATAFGVTAECKASILNGESEYIINTIIKEISDQLFRVSQ